MKDIIRVPTKVDMGVYKRDTKKNKIGDKKKGFIINLNNWRNANPFLRTTADTNFRQYVIENFDLGIHNQIALLYTLYVKGRRKKDVMNVISIFDKYFSDTLTSVGAIPDDDYEYLPLVVGMFGGQTMDEEYVEVHIIDIDELTTDGVGQTVANIIADNIYI